jgi:hypothetical protein
VELTFTSRSYVRGKAITLTAIALSIIWMVVGFAWDRRRTPGPRGAAS